MDQQEALNALAVVGNGVVADALETETLDFKVVGESQKSTYNLLADALVCFANARGGTVVLGVDDKATSRHDALRGVPADYSIDSIRKGVFDRTRPPITPFVNDVIINGVRLILITVPEGVMPHSNAAGLSTRRLGKECLPYPPDQQREVMIARGQVDWSADSSSVDFSNLSAIEFERLRRILTAGGRDNLADLSNKALLESLRLIASDGSVTNAGVLLLGDESLISTVVPSYGYSFQFRPSSGSEATGRIRGNRPLIAAIPILTEAIEARREIHPLNLAGGVQLSLTDYPSEAIRELIINAFIHRSYETSGTVDVEHSPERLAIVSPGGLVAGVTPANILTYPSTPRNRLLTETVSVLQLAERTGQGVDRAYREMLRIGKEPPQFEDKGTLVRATLAGGIGNDAFARFVSDLPVKAGRDLNVLLALSHLRHNSSIDASKLANIIQRTPIEAQEVLAAMADEYGLLEATRRTISKPFPTYRLRSEALAAMSRSVTYRRRVIDDTDQKVIEHVKEYGFITNQTIRRLFDLHVYAARDLINSLRDREILEKIGDARGGVGVRYGPGPKFPKKKS
ncbi:putative DNA binding domain-containing protein [Nonomuraea sp. K274]|uniref:DNA binding domain-containing protein n=1 Tax=Nonomuraea cypriaca TaxID=1187855 RepID=A0A931A118_9ACTN|nr:ATP-binding protein [Nonomuraea cypriaca]MBF8184226.1 putative DNA binding domain-containing protein [Nonomuraea cypriaca]